MNKLLTDTQSNKTGWKAKVPNWIDYYSQRPIVSLLEELVFSMKAYVHKLGDSENTFYPAIHVYMGTQGETITDKMSEHTLKEAIKAFNKTLEKGWYYEWDYDDEGDKIESSERKIEYDKWAIMDFRSGEVLRKGEINRGESNLEEER